MTLSESARIVGILQFNYPDRFTGFSDEALKTYIRNWHSFFKEDSYELVAEAVRVYITTSSERFMPNVGQIKEQIRKLRTPEEMSDGEAWARISRALENGSYGAEEEFKKLPPVLKRVVGSPSQLREWAQMDVETVQSVVASNVQRSYRAIAKTEAEWSKLPPGYREKLQKLTGNIFGRLELEDGSYGQEEQQSPAEAGHERAGAHPGEHR